MAIATVFSRGLTGIDAPLVTIEVHISNGLPSLSIVGLAEMAVRESKDRVRSALLNSNFNFPQQRITINLAPADFDLTANAHGHRHYLKLEWLIVC